MSLTVETENLLRVRIETLSLKELEEHAQELRNSVIELSDGLASPKWNANARYNAIHLVKRIAVRLDETLSLIDDRRCEKNAPANEEQKLQEENLAPPTM